VRPVTRTDVAYAVVVDDRCCGVNELAEAGGGEGMDFEEVSAAPRRRYVRR
jgi:hypothetical protein